jgi:D-beta-D-heptose 7-phosphate kinase/D-beta-D-heptose 1-phosphate adenosyltransferase
MQRVGKVSMGGGIVKIQRVKGFIGNGKNPLVEKKVVPREELALLGEVLHKRHLKIAFTTGVYDMIHVGHVRYLELAAMMGDVLVVGLNSDSSVREMKGPGRPILDENQRAEMLCYLSSVSYVTIYPELTGAETIKLLKPDAYLCVEGSWNGELAAKAEVVAMAGHKGRVFYSPRQSPTQSTTAILERVRGNVLKELQRSFEVNGKQA